MLTNTTHTVGLVFCSRRTSLHNDLYRPTVLNRLCLSPSLLYHTLPQLATKSDVLLENYPPRKLDAFGLGYTALSAANPRLVYCSITGYGPTGPKSHRLGYDVVASAESGLMHVTGPKVRGGGGKEGRGGEGEGGEGREEVGREEEEGRESGMANTCGFNRASKLRSLQMALGCREMLQCHTEEYVATVDCLLSSCACMTGQYVKWFIFSSPGRGRMENQSKWAWQ